MIVRHYHVETQEARRLPVLREASFLTAYKARRHASVLKNFVRRCTTVTIRECYCRWREGTQ